MKTRSFLGMALTGLITTFLATSPAAAKNGSPKSPTGLGLHLPGPVSDADYRDNGQPHPDKVALGNLLFFEKELSGNRNIACATCHHPMAATGDGLSLSVGEGARGLGVTRDTGQGDDAIKERVPRNAPPLFNLGARQFTRMFHDGRVENDPSHPSGFRSPAGDNLPLGLESVLAVQAMFPVTSATEMAGQAGENSVAAAAAAGNLHGAGGVWEQLAGRLQAISEYVDLFKKAYPGQITKAGDITFVHAANAIAAFEAVFYRADRSPFDAFLRGDPAALNLKQRQGMNLFYGKAGCYQCHSGPFQTDLNFYAICLPQVGPGKGDGADGREDFGRERVTNDTGDRYRFRTPSLRNVALTAPYGHDGAYGTLEAMIRHHADPLSSLENYDPSQLVLPSRPDLDAHDLVVQNNPSLRAALAGSIDLTPVPLSDDEVDLLVEFLRALTDPNRIDLRLDVPLSLPSGLPVFD